MAIWNSPNPEAQEKLREREPYSFQRSRNAKHWAGSRPSQPNTNQPNAKPPASGWQRSSEEYWQEVWDNYLRRRA